jgi:hypothetical protein
VPETNVTGAAAEASLMERPTNETNVATVRPIWIEMPLLRM